MIIANKTELALASLLLVITIAACQTDASRSKKVDITGNELLNHVIQLKEFKLAEKQIDSLKKATGISVEISIDVVDQSFLSEDSAKNISLAFINRKSDFEQLILFTVKYDKGQKKIISVEKNAEGQKKKEENVPADIKI